MWKRRRTRFVVLLVSLNALGCSQRSSRDTRDDQGERTLGGEVLDPSEFIRFSHDARLTTEQYAVIQEFLVRFERNFVALRRTGREDMLGRLGEHTRSLLFSELRPEQTALYEGYNLPGTKSFRPRAQ